MRLTKRGKAATTTTWLGDGIYSKSRTDRDGKPYAAFFVRVWIPSEKRMRVFKAGRTLRSAERLRIRIMADPERAMEKRRQQADPARSVTVAQLYRTFTTGYRGRGGTGYYESVLRHFADSLGTKPVPDLTPQTFERIGRISCILPRTLGRVGVR